MSRNGILLPLLSLMAFVSASCADKVYSEANVIKIDKTEKTLSDSVFLDDMKTIKLETRDDCALSGIEKISEHAGKYYVKDIRQDKIFIFDDRGKVVKIVDRKGRAQGEYVNLVDFTIDKSQKELLVLAYPQKILHFTLEGQYKSETKLDSYYKEIACDKDFYYLRYETYANHQQKNYSVRCVDKATGKGKDLIPLESERAPFCSLGAGLFDNGQEIYFVRFFDSNVYQLAEGKDLTRYQLDFGDYKFSENLLEERFDCAKLSSLAWKKKMMYALTKLKEGSRYLLFSSNLFAYNLYDRKTRQCVHFSTVGSHRFNVDWSTYLPVDGSDNKVCMVVESALVNSMEGLLKSQKNLEAEVREKMKHMLLLYDKQTDNDNPMLLVFTLK